MGRITKEQFDGVKEIVIDCMKNGTTVYRAAQTARCHHRTVERIWANYQAESQSENHEKGEETLPPEKPDIPPSSPSVPEDDCGW